MNKKFEEFLKSKGHTPEDYEKMEIEAKTDLGNEYLEERQAEIQKMIDEKADAESIKELVKELNEANVAQFTELTKAMIEIGKQVRKNGENKQVKAEKGLRAYIEENSEILKGIKERNVNAKQLEFTIKGTQGATDIGQRDDYATFLPGTIRKPVRRTRILDLFRRKKVSTEYIKYREENVVTRDAKFVVACATSTHNTKKTWQNRTVELAKIRDIVDICLDMLSDYDFVESEIYQLITESVQLKADYELLLGASSTATDMLSIDSISSEFNPANVLAPFSGAFEDANIEQLVDAMAAQINIFGQENMWMADTVIMNYRDFILYRNLKDANGNKLIKTLSDGTATIAGLTIVTSPIVPANEIYVFDSTQGEILDRQSLTVKTSYENRDNIEHEMVTIVAVARLQFHVAMINRDAFMKSSDVAAAIAAITNTPS
jgi:hypothetical protein